MKRKTGLTIQPPPPTVLPLRKAGYVNLVGIVGDGAAEDTYLAWCQANGINTLYLYGLTTILATTYAPFVAFYDKAINAGITKLFAQRASENRHLGTGFSSTKSYNLANPSRRLHFGLENEFWNYEFVVGATVLDFSSRSAFPTIGEALTTYNDNSESDGYQKSYVFQGGKYVKIIDLPDSLGNLIYRNWLKVQTNIYNYAKSVGLDSDFYIGHLHDNVEYTTPEAIANAVIKVVDTIEVSWYVTSKIFGQSGNGLNYLRDRLNQLGAAGIAAGKKVNIVFIYAGTTELMEEWFATIGNNLLKALNISVSVIKANPGSVLTSISGFNVAGFAGYALPL